jgi:competence protein ComEC
MFRVFLLFITGFGIEQLAYAWNFNFLFIVGGFVISLYLITKNQVRFGFRKSLGTLILCTSLILIGGFCSFRMHSSANNKLNTNNIFALVSREGNPSDTIVNYRNGIVKINAIYSSGIWTKANAKIWLQLPKDVAIPFKNGREYLLQGNLSAIDESSSNSSNNSFDSWLLRNHVYHKAFAKALFLHADDSFSQSWTQFLLSNAFHYRKKLLDKWKVEGANQEEHALFSALILGDRSGVSSETIQAFSSSGIIHLLAVSGLHVGLIYAAILFLLSRFRIFKELPSIRISFILLGLWIYAFMTGLSPSVIRAASMFSFHAFASLLKRKVSTFNLLSTAALIMIFIKPDIIFHIGFQLSFIAVWGIIAFEPLSSYITSFLPKRLKFIGQAAGVSCSAQVATMPFTIFYFHVFPIYFLPANLIAVPLATLITYTGLVGMFLVNIPFLNNVVIEITCFLLRALLILAQLTADLPKAVYSGIYSNYLILVIGLVLLVLIRLCVLNVSIYLIKLIIGSCILMSLISFLGRNFQEGKVEVQKLSKAIIVKRYGIYSNEAWILNVSAHEHSNTFSRKQLVQYGLLESRNYFVNKYQLTRNQYSIQINSNTKLFLNKQKTKFKEKYTVALIQNDSLISKMVLNDFFVDDNN